VPVATVTLFRCGNRYPGEKEDKNGGQGPKWQGGKERFKERMNKSNKESRTQGKRDMFGMAERDTGSPVVVQYA